MAPRRRQPKIGLRRIDAAVDSLEPLGFPKALVSKTVNSLLKVYGGDEGWRFIEEASYQLVIDTILEQQQQEEEEQVKQENLVIPEKGACEKEASTLDACASSTRIDRVGETSASCESLGGEEHVAATRAVIDNDGKHSTDHVIGENIDWEFSSSMNLNTVQLTESTISGSEGLHSEASHNIAGEVCDQKSESCGMNHFIPRRKPCFGWISDDEDDNQVDKAEENYIISLSKKHEPAKSPKTLWCKGKRKSQWDEYPSNTMVSPKGGIVSDTY